MSDLNGIMGDEEENCSSSNAGDPTWEEDMERAVKCALMADEEGFEEQIVVDGFVVEGASDDDTTTAHQENEQCESESRGEIPAERHQNGGEPLSEEDVAVDIPSVVAILERQAPSEASLDDTESQDTLSQSIPFVVAQIMKEHRNQMSEEAATAFELRILNKVEKIFCEKFHQIFHHLDTRSTVSTEPPSTSGSESHPNENGHFNVPASLHTPSSPPQRAHRARSMDTPPCSPDPPCASISEEEKDTTAAPVRPQPASQPHPDRPDPPEEDVFYDCHGRPRKVAYDSETHSYSRDERPYHRQSRPFIQRRATRGDFHSPPDSQTQQATCGDSHTHYVHESDDSTCAAQSYSHVEELLTPARARLTVPWPSFHSEQAYSRERTFAARPTSPSQVSGARPQDKSNKEQDPNRPTKRKTRQEDYLQQVDDAEDGKRAAKPTPTSRVSDANAEDEDLKARDSNTDGLARKPRPKSPTSAGTLYLELLHYAYEEGDVASVHTGASGDADEDAIKKAEQEAKANASTQQRRSQGLDTDDNGLDDSDRDDDDDSLRKDPQRDMSAFKEASATSTASRVPRPRPPTRVVTPGAFAIDGIDGPTSNNEDNETVQVGSDTVNSPDLIEAEVVNSEGGNSAILNRMNDLEDAVRQNQPPVVEAEIQRAEPVHRNAPLVVKVSCCVIS